MNPYDYGNLFRLFHLAGILALVIGIIVFLIALM